MQGATVARSSKFIRNELLIAISLMRGGLLY